MAIHNFIRKHAGQDDADFMEYDRAYENINSEEVQDEESYDDDGDELNVSSGYEMEFTRDDPSLGPPCPPSELHRSATLRLCLASVPRLPPLHAFSLPVSPLPLPGIWENWDASSPSCLCIAWFLWPLSLHILLLTCGLVASCFIVPSVILVRTASSLFVLERGGWISTAKCNSESRESDTSLSCGSHRLGSL
ncbi:hypothetical protein V6N11_033873 [Hibiscus sabdariffa]|uniref:Uncharacterized protein n=1 Tax=Hibiscus sabdariffa TaxID=183260 RepID=A0ABR2S125_9ROSI